MGLHTTALNCADANGHQQTISSTFREKELSEVEVGFLTVGLTDLKVEYGVMHGEVIRSIEDIHIGDEMRLKGLHFGFAAHDRRHRCSSDAHSPDHATTALKRGGYVQKHQVQLMSEHGELVRAYVVRPEFSADVQPYMLLPREFRSSGRYCVLAVTEA